MAVLSINDAGPDVYDYDDAATGPMSLFGEGAVGDALVIQASSVVRPQTPGGGGSLGDVSRFGATLDNRIARWHGTGPETQNSTVILDDSGNMSQIATLSADTFQAGSGPTTLNNAVGEILLVAMEQDGASLNEALVWNGSEWAPGGVMPVGGAVGGSGAIGTLPKWTAAQALGNSLVSESGSTVSIAGLLTVNSDGDGATVLGRARIGTVTPDAMYLSHFDHFSAVDYALLQGLSGTTILNAPSGSNVSLGLGGIPELVAQPTSVIIPNFDFTVALGNVEVSGGILGVGTAPLTDAHVDMRAPSTLTTLAGSVFLQAFDNAGDGNFGAGIIFGQANGSTGATRGAQIVAIQDTADGNSVSISLATHDDDGAGPRAEALNLTSLQKAIFRGDVGIRTDPTIALDVDAKGGTTSIGGVVVKLTNDTGSNSVAGQLVIASTGTDEAFETAIPNDARVIGVVYNAGVADGSEVWVVVAGHADILVDAGGCLHGERFTTGITAGSADVNNSPSNTVHFREIGHCLQTRVGAGLARGIVHLN